MAPWTRNIVTNRGLRYEKKDCDLYANVSEALELRESSALVAISILIQLSETPSPELRVLTSPLRKIVYRASSRAAVRLETIFSSTLNAIEVEKKATNNSEAIICQRYMRDR
ncbi:carbonic anhydrase-related protein 10-like [Tropilaelaps mercedesae]|uniref:Carbonic anhydrase-related protein 10-like n=1 Tax=Tropilaelaps mercedesae TaxID=418985 RepID=A0A1V9Y2E4_9ACAR|nr:carbonic anhydrase-related protein 10-like [Tropilaelaps mercedesae]